MDLLAALVPGFVDLLDLASVLVVGLGLVGVGRLATPRLIPEIQLMVGWGILCLVLTSWGCLTTMSLAIPTVLLGACGLYGAVLTSRRGDAGLWRIACLSLPIWAVMATATPSQVDTWLNLLPNAAYLVDHGIFPRADRPASYSFIPVAPYNTQFVAYAASLLRGTLVGNAMSTFNILLQCAAGGILARAIAGGERQVGWRHAALGLLLALPLNPGFIPRAFFASYGEAPIAVAAMAVVWLGAEAITAEKGRPLRDIMVALACVLAALVNVKQSSIGMVASFAAAAALVLWTQQTASRLRLPFILSLLPSLVLYALWRWWATESFAVGELKALPLSQWNTGLIPEILKGVAMAIGQKGGYFLAILALLVGTAMRLRQGVRDLSALVLVLASTTILFDDAFIIFTYVAHFEPSWAVQAHSYFRYMAQLSLLLMLGLIHLLRPATIRWFATGPGLVARSWGHPAIVGMLLAPVIFLPYLRFDREAPQPEIDAMVHALKPQLKPDAALAIIVPGDLDDIAGSYLRGLVLYRAPRQAFPEVTTVRSADTAALDALVRAGVDQALLSCSDLASAVPGLPVHSLVLLQHDGAGWRLAAARPYPPGLGRRHWAGLLPKPIFCGAPS